MTTSRTGHTARVAAANVVVRGSAEILGKIATFGMLRGDVLRGARLAEHLGGSTLASLIATDKRAVSVRVAVAERPAR